MSLITKASSPKPSPPPKPVFNSLDEARCNRIVRPAPACMKAKVEWFNKTEGWTKEQLTERYQKLNHDFLLLHSLLKSPPADWDLTKWLEMEQRASRWQGQLEGLELRMKNMRRAGTTAAYTPEKDPFQNV